MVPEMLSRTVLDSVGSPYSKSKSFLRLGIVFTVSFSNVSYIFFLDDGLNDFLGLDAKPNSFPVMGCSYSESKSIEVFPASESLSTWLSKLTF